VITLVIVKCTALQLTSPALLRGSAGERCAGNWGRPISNSPPTAGRIFASNQTAVNQGNVSSWGDKWTSA
jgi:hypothetical protein